MNDKTIPILLLTGYLGSGKTTLLNRILANERGVKFAVIVNDIGEINIDAALIRKGGIVGQDAASPAPDLVALENGCICCSLQTDLIEQIVQLASSGEFDYIVIEASGICEPASIAQTICSIPSMESYFRRGVLPRLDCIVTVVDALRMCDEFDCGESLSVSHDDGDIDSLVVDQIEFCNIILLNKIDEVTPDEAARVKAVVRALQPKAQIVECNYCDVEIDKLLNTRLFDFEKVATSATWIRELEHHHDHDHCCHGSGEECHCHHHHHHQEGEAAEYGIETFVYYRRLPFDLNRFDYFVASSWPQSIIRAKGVVYFNHNRDMTYLFEQAGRQKKLTEAGLWYAAAPDEEIERLKVAEPGLAQDWDPVYGDRMIKIVIIGRNMNRPAIEAMFDRCLI